MKKFISLLLVVIFMLSAFSLIVSAEDTDTEIAAETVWATTAISDSTDVSPETDIAGNPTKITYVGMDGIDVYNEWEKNGYPDDIGSVTIWQEGYNPTSGKTELGTYYIIYVVKGTSDARKEELKTMMGSDHVEFRECTISRNKQYEYVDALNDALGKYAYRIEATADMNDLRIIFYFPEENHSVIKEYLMENYADLDYLFILRAGVDPADLDANYGVPEIATGVITIGASVPEDNNKWVLYAVIAVFAVFVSVASYFVFRKSYSRTLALSNGDTASKNPTPSKKEIETEIASNNSAPSEKVIDNIFKKM